MKEEVIIQSIGITKKKEQIFFLYQYCRSCIKHGSMPFINYADKEEIKALFAIVGIKNAATVFFEQIEKSERAANNYEAVSRNYFTLYFKKYAS